MDSEIGPIFLLLQARLAQSVEHETLNLRVVGSSPTLGVGVLSLSSSAGNIPKDPHQSRPLIQSIIAEQMASMS